MCAFFIISIGKQTTYGSRKGERSSKSEFIFLLLVELLIFYQAEIPKINETLESKEAELEMVKEEGMQVNSQLHHNMEPMNQAKLEVEEENKALKVK